MLVSHHHQQQQHHYEDCFASSSSTSTSAAASPPALLSAVAKGITNLSNIRGLENMAHLLSLNLHLNAIHRIEARALSPLVNLVEMNLSGNQIVKMEGLSALVNLRVLDLSCNRIEAVEGLHGLIHLRKIYLASNKIHSLAGFSEIISSNNSKQPNTSSKKKLVTSSSSTFLLASKDINRSTSATNDVEKHFHVEKSSSSVESKKNGQQSRHAELEFIDLRNNRLDNLLEFKHLIDLPHLKQLRLKNGDKKKSSNQLVSAFGVQDSMDQNNSFFSSEKQQQQHDQEETMMPFGENINNNNMTRNNFSSLSAEENPICVSDEPDYLFRISEVCPQILMIDQIAVAIKSNQIDENGSSGKNSTNERATTTAIGNFVPPNSKFAELRHSSEYPLVSATLRFREDIIKREREAKEKANPKPDFSSVAAGEFEVYQKQYPCPTTTSAVSRPLSRKNSSSSTTVVSHHNPHNNHQVKERTDDNDQNNNTSTASSTTSKSTSLAALHQSNNNKPLHQQPRLSFKLVNRSSQTTSTDEVERKEVEERIDQTELEDLRERNRKLESLLEASQNQLNQKDESIQNLEHELDQVEGLLDDERRDFDRSRQHWELEAQRLELSEEKLKMKIQEEVVSSQQKLAELKTSHRDQVAALKAEIERLQLISTTSTNEVDNLKQQLRSQQQHAASTLEKTKRDLQRRISELDERLQTARTEIISQHSNTETEIRSQKKSFDAFLASQYEIWSLITEEAERRQQLVMTNFFSPTTGTQRYEREFLLNVTDHVSDLESQLTELVDRESELRKKLFSKRNLLHQSTSEIGTCTSLDINNHHHHFSSSIACGEDKPMSATVVLERSRWIEMGKRFDSAINEAEHARRTTTDAFNSLLEEKNRREALEEALSCSQDEVQAALAKVAEKESELDDRVSKFEMEMSSLKSELEEKDALLAASKKDPNAAEFYVELREELQRMKKDRDDLDFENNSLRSRISETEAELVEKSSELEECIAEAQEKLNEKRDKIARLQEDNDKMSIALQESETKQHEMSQRIETQTLLHNQLRSASDLLRGHIVSVTEALEREHEKNADSTQKISKLETENQEMKQSLEKMREISKKKMQELARLFSANGGEEF